MMSSSQKRTDLSGPTRKPRSLAEMAALLPPAEQSFGGATGCNHIRRFYAYLDESENYTATYHTCSQQSFFCSDTFRNRLLAHPCRTTQLSEATSVVAVNPIYRTLSHAAPNGNAAHKFSRKMLREMPSNIRRHPHIYLLLIDLFSMDGYRDVLPPKAPVAFIGGDTMYAWKRGRNIFDQAMHHEPQIPGPSDACYLYVPEQRVITLPYYQADPTSRANLAASRHNFQRPNKVFYYAGIHGMATSLRRRLYDLCAMQPASSWNCPKRPLSYEDSLTALEDATFCFLPAGDAPTRVTMWPALARGCIPVLFSSCAQNIALQQHSHLLPADPLDAPGFGLKRWAVLVNQTAVMTDDTHLASVLAGVGDADVRRLRAEITREVVDRFSFDEEQSHPSDVLSYMVDTMLNVNKGPLPEHGPTLPADMSVWGRGGSDQACDWCEAKPVVTREELPAGLK